MPFRLTVFDKIALAWTALLVAFKLTGLLSWSWWTVTAPAWIWFGFCIVLGVVGGVLLSMLDSQ